jgi:hypothetical protein
MRYVIQGLVIALLVAILAGVAMLVFAMSALLNVPAGVSGRLGGVGTAVTDAQQALQDIADPSHPPRGLAYDNEFSALQLAHVGDALPGGAQYTLWLQTVRRRENAESPDIAQYAIVHAQLRQPRETRLLGQLVRTDADPHDHVVYKGETFRIGRTVYRVNWVSDADAAMAFAAFRNPDAVTATLKFDYE